MRIEFERNRAYTRPILRVLALVAMLAILLSFASCSDKDDSNDEPHVLAYAGVELSECVKIGQYKGLTVSVKDGETKAAAIWRVIYASGEVITYPSEQVEYYASQSRARCEYYASIHNVSYEEALEALGYTEESLIEEAQTLVFEDLVGMALRADAGIELTDEEKDKYFDKYAEKYAHDWGYNLAYVESELSEQVYGSMLYDKTTEYLLKHNEFVEE